MSHQWQPSRKSLLEPRHTCIGCSGYTDLLYTCCTYSMTFCYFDWIGFDFPMYLIIYSIIFQFTTAGLPPCWTTISISKCKIKPNTYIKGWCELLWIIYKTIYEFLTSYWPNYQITVGEKNPPKIIERFIKFPRKDRFHLCVEKFEKKPINFCDVNSMRSTWLSWEIKLHNNEKKNMLLVPKRGFADENITMVPMLRVENVKDWVLPCPGFGRTSR